MSRRPDKARSVAALVNVLSTSLTAAWAATMAGAVIYEQMEAWPPPPPTAAESAAASPSAHLKWSTIYPLLSARLSEPPPEVGEVWATRTGRICGFVNDRRSAVDSMTRFYTVGMRPMLQRDDRSQYRRVWTGCINSRWVELHVGSEKTGFCATTRGRASILGRMICVGWTP